MLKYLKGQPLRVKFAGEEIILPAPLVADFDLLNPILRGFGNTTLETATLKSAAIQALADRLIERAKLQEEQIKVLQDNSIAFYFAFGVELDIYLPALFPKTDDENASKGDENPLPSKNPSNSSSTA